ncbi:N-acetyltransferase-like protein [Xylogone sp. PMI_703]|nr:N-acetyltransferase-like protein [Xylogone sp. PMI_703]
MAEYAATTPRLWLEPMTVEKHLDGFWDMWRDPIATTWMPHHPKTTREEALELMLWALPNEQNPDIDKFAILLRPSEQDEGASPVVIGMVGTNRESPQGLETGYFMNSKYWGKGYATEAFKAFLDMYWTLENRKNVNKLVAKIDPGNVASEKVTTKLGAVRSGLLKEVYERAVEPGVKRDIGLWYFYRPGWEPSDQETGEYKN